jgi:hypothetical protein
MGEEAVQPTEGEWKRDDNILGTRVYRIQKSNI